LLRQLRVLAELATNPPHAAGGAAGAAPGDDASPSTLASRRARLDLIERIGGDASGEATAPGIHSSARSGAEAAARRRSRRQPEDVANLAEGRMLARAASNVVTVFGVTVHTAASPVDGDWFTRDARGRWRSSVNNAQAACQSI
jgi:hypothetical protein